MTRFVKFTSPIHDKPVYIDASKVKSVTYDLDGYYVKVGGVLVKEDMDTVMRMLTECATVIQYRYQETKFEIHFESDETVNRYLSSDLHEYFVMSSEFGKFKGFTIGFDTNVNV